MKRSHFWFMLEGLFCGLLQILVWECIVSTWARPWMRIALSIVGVLLSAVGFYFLMRRFPATKKKKKFALSVLFWIVILPAWVVYGRAFGLAIFPHRVMAAAEYASLLVQFLSWYAAGLAVTRLGIILYYYIFGESRYHGSVVHKTVVQIAVGKLTFGNEPAVVGADDDTAAVGKAERQLGNDSSGAAFRFLRQLPPSDLFG